MFEVRRRCEEVKEGKQKGICFKSKPFDAEIARLKLCLHTSGLNADSDLLTLPS